MMTSRSCENNSTESLHVLAKSRLTDLNKAIKQKS